MKQLTPIFLAFTALILTAFTAKAQEYSPDLITLDQFEETALVPKEEVWVIDFWATWCGPCVHEIPRMKQLHKKYEDRGVKFVSISWDRNEPQWLNGLEHFKMPWTHLRAKKSEAAWLDEYFPHNSIPTVFIIDRDGGVKKVKNVGKLDKAIYKAL